MVVSSEPVNAPDWNLSNFFPSLSSTEFAEAIEKLKGTTTEAEKYFRAQGIEVGSTGATAEETTFTELVSQMNDLSRQLRLVRAYVSAYVTTDSKNDLALAKASELDLVSVRIGKLSKSFCGWLGSADSTKLLSETVIGKEYEFLIRKAIVEAQHQLSASEEALVSDLELTGGIAWKKVHSNVTSQIEVEIDNFGIKETVTMSAVRTLAYDPNRTVRAKAYGAELAAWKKWEVPLSAAMNSIKGETLLLTSRRGWAHPLDSALFSANVDRATLEAMMEAARNSLPDFRRYFRAKAKALGIEKLAFYDLFAPLPESGREWSWQEAESFVEQRFAEYSPKMAEFAVRAFRERWVDYLPKPGKVDGAYCMGVRGDESRILMNFKPSFGAVSTLAHELGHGYHNLCFRHRPELQRTTPMTLAETASIFCETIIRKAAMARGSNSEKLAVLEASLQGSSQVVVDIMSRYLFETAVFEARTRRELSPTELCDLMRKAQVDTYGEGLDESALHPYMWAAKSHYYGRSYYNFPYMFGLLFSLGLYSIYEAEGKSFQPRYDELLASTGLANADFLAEKFGIDLRDTKFWEGSLHQIRNDIDQFESLV